MWLTLKKKHPPPSADLCCLLFTSTCHGGSGWIAFKWASYQIRKIAGCACAGNAGNIFPRRRFRSKSLVSDSGMHHGTCVTHVPWCMSGSLTRSDWGNFPGIPGACAPAILRISQEAHGGRWVALTYTISNLVSLLLGYFVLRELLEVIHIKRLLGRIMAELKQCAT